MYGREVDINFNFKWVGWLVVPYLLMHTLSLGPILGIKFSEIRE